VEEQFYLVWPWIVLRFPRQTVVKICGAVLVISPFVRLAFRLAGAHPRFLYANTLCRLDPIAMGALIAAWLRSPEMTTDKLARFVRAALPIGVAGWTVSILAPGAPACRDLRLSFVAVTFGALLVSALLGQNSDAFFSKALRNSCLKTIARISFALYLFNLPIYSIMHGNFFTRVSACIPSRLAGVTTLAISNAVLFAAAALSWRFFESRILRLKERL